MAVYLSPKLCSSLLSATPLNAGFFRAVPVADASRKCLYIQAHKGGIKAMSDEQLEAAIEILQAIVDQEFGEKAKIIEGVAEPMSEPGPRRKAKRLADLTLTEPE